MHWSQLFLSSGRKKSQMRKQLFPSGILLQSHTAFGAHVYTASESQIWQCPPLLHADSHFWKRISESLVMKYCHLSNLASCPEQAILLCSLHSSTSMQWCFAPMSPLPTHFLGQTLRPAHQSGRTKLLLRLLRASILRLSSLSCAMLRSWLGVRTCSRHFCPFSQNINHTEIYQLWYRAMKTSTESLRNLAHSTFDKYPSGTRKYRILDQHHNRQGSF